MKISDNKIILLQPDDWHLHLRDGAILRSLVPFTTRVFGRAIVMPNLRPPITTVDSARRYRERIMDAVPNGDSFTPLMTVYLTDNLSPKVLEEGKKEGVFTAAKLYPANATTNSAEGVTNIKEIYNLLEMMERLEMPLLIHGEVVDSEVDIFDREAVFIDRYLEPLLKRYPDLKVILEHITTEDAVQFVEANMNNLAATITPHHLHLNRNSMFQGGLRSDYYCLPIVKREKHRLALRKAATSGKSCFFIGTDSAPHTRQFKESSCSCAGIFNASHALQSYAQVFEEEGKISELENFCSIYGPEFYGLPKNNKFVTLIKKKEYIPDSFELLSENKLKEKIVPFHSGEMLTWSLLDN